MWDEEKNRALVRWLWEEVWVKGSVNAMDEFMAANYVDHPNLPGLSPGPEGMKQALSTYRTACPGGSRRQGSRRHKDDHLRGGS